MVVVVETEVVEPSTAMAPSVADWEAIEVFICEVPSTAAPPVGVLAGFTE